MRLNDNLEGDETSFDGDLTNTDDTESLLNCLSEASLSIAAGFVEWSFNSVE